MDGGRALIVLVGAWAVLGCACSADQDSAPFEPPTVERVIVTGTMTSRDGTDACVDAESPEPTELLDTNSEVCGYALEGLVPPGIRPGSSVGATLVITDEGESSPSHFWDRMWLEDGPSPGASPDHVEPWIDPETGVGYYPDEEIRQGSHECVRVVDNARGAALTFACEYTNREPGDTMVDVADRMGFLTSAALDDQLRSEELPEELRGVIRRVTLQVSRPRPLTAEDEAAHPAASGAVETRTWHKRGAPNEPIEYGPETSHKEDMVVFLAEQPDGGFIAVGFELTELPDVFPPHENGAPPSEVGADPGG